MFLLILLLPVAFAHPGGFTAGRGSCGLEYNNLKQAFEIADIAEAWYVRRIATCDAPYLWTTFETTQEQQQVYIAANIPEIPRFNDNLQFNGILFGPGLSTPDSSAQFGVPKGLEYPIQFNSLDIGQRMFQQPDNYNTCDLVKSNAVMNQYAKVKDGRCTETIKLDADYKDELVAGIEYSSEWLYSVNHHMASVGRYWLLTWLTDRSTNELANGKYDLTLAPWTWSKYADADTQKKVQAQGSTCQCSFNALEWRETTLNRLSNVPEAALIKALPKQKACSQATRGGSVCKSADGKDPMSTDTEIEWGGHFDLIPGSTYHWNYYARRGCKNNVCETTYPDPAISVLVSASHLIGQTIKVAEVEADKIMKASLSNTVVHNGVIDIGNGGTAVPLKSMLTMNSINATDTTMITSYQIVLPSTAPASWWFFTQHVPHEFSANFLTCAAGPCLTANGGANKYVYPTNTSLYLGASKYVNNWASNAKTSISDGEISPYITGGLNGQSGDKGLDVVVIVLIVVVVVLMIGLVAVSSVWRWLMRREKRVLNA
jgi:hypothetical protein